MSDAKMRPVSRMALLMLRTQLANPDSDEAKTVYDFITQTLQRNEWLEDEVNGLKEQVHVRTKLESDDSYESGSRCLVTPSPALRSSSVFEELREKNFAIEEMRKKMMSLVESSARLQNQERDGKGNSGQCLEMDCQEPRDSISPLQKDVTVLLKEKDKELEEIKGTMNSMEAEIIHLRDLAKPSTPALYQSPKTFGKSSSTSQNNETQDDQNTSNTDLQDETSLRRSAHDHCTSFAAKDRQASPQAQTPSSTNTLQRVEEHTESRHDASRTLTVSPKCLLDTISKQTERKRKLNDDAEDKGEPIAKRAHIVAPLILDPSIQKLANMEAVHGKAPQKPCSETDATPATSDTLALRQPATLFGGFFDSSPSSLEKSSQYGTGTPSNQALQRSEHPTSTVNITYPEKPAEQAHSRQQRVVNTGNSFAVPKQGVSVQEKSLQPLTNPVRKKLERPSAAPPKVQSKASNNKTTQASTAPPPKTRKYKEGSEDEWEDVFNLHLSTKMARSAGFEDPIPYYSIDTLKQNEKRFSNITSGIKLLTTFYGREPIDPCEPCREMGTWCRVARNGKMKMTTQKCAGCKARNITCKPKVPRPKVDDIRKAASNNAGVS